jgi:hypothetical protein
MNAVSLLDKLVRITRYRGEAKNRTARVVEVRDTLKKPVSYKQYKRNKIGRSQYLITVHDLARDEFRSYYDEYVTLELVNQGLFTRVWIWFVNN